MLYRNLLFFLVWLMVSSVVFVYSILHYDIRSQLFNNGLISEESAPDLPDSDDFWQTVQIELWISSGFLLLFWLLGHRYRGVVFLCLLAPSSKHQQALQELGDIPGRLEPHTLGKAGNKIIHYLDHHQSDILDGITMINGKYKRFEAIFAMQHEIRAKFQSFLKQEGKTRLFGFGVPHQVRHGFHLYEHPFFTLPGQLSLPSFSEPVEVQQPLLVCLMLNTDDPALKECIQVQDNVSLFKQNLKALAQHVHHPSPYKGIYSRLLEGLWVLHSIQWALVEWLLDKFSIHQQEVLLDESVFFLYSAFSSQPHLWRELKKKMIN